MNTILKANVKKIARELGFFDCRIAPADPPAHADAFKQWIADGCHGEMAWLAKNVERRTTPEEVLPGAKSMIVLGTNYYGGEPETVPGGGKIARYAWGFDYHDVLLDKLKDLNAYLEDVGGTQRYYVDTGPILERDYAAMSGLGWNGKSTVQIHPKLGTWFLLSEILTTLELEPDPPLSDHCGKCTACIDACPTQAITQPHRVDARKCISYLTIEHRGSIPLEYRRAIGDRIFGCDDCLAVCPWNRFAKESNDSHFAAREFVTNWSLLDFLTLDEESFRTLFQKSPVKRTKLAGFLRNVCIAIGNTGTDKDIPHLFTAGEKHGELVKEHADWAIKEIESRTSASS